MNRTVRTEDLEQLMTHEDRPCVSIFMPTHSAGRDVQQDPIRLKNLLRDAEQQLGALGLKTSETARILDPSRALLEQASFWRQQGDGLSVFLSPTLSRTYRLPLRLDEAAIVAERFHVKPLLRLLSGDGRFYVLALSQHGVRLLQATRHTVSEMPLDGVPGSVAEAVGREPERQLQVRTGTPGPTRAALFHGHGYGAEDAKKDVFQFFRQVDEQVTRALRDGAAPLVLAGVDYLQPIYRRANTYRHLLPEGVGGNQEKQRDDEIHEQAWTLVRPRFEKAEADAAARYRELAGTGRTTNRLQETLLAAYAGRVDVLFVAEGERWGRFDPADGTTRIHGTPEPGDEDLLDLAAMRTLLSGGTVYVKPEAEMPDDGPVAAILRY